MLRPMSELFTGDQRKKVKAQLLDALRRTAYGAIELDPVKLNIPAEAISNVLEELCREANGALTVTKWPSGALGLSRTTQLKASLSAEGSRAMTQAGLIFEAGDLINYEKPQVSPDPNITPEMQAEYEAELAKKRQTWIEKGIVKK